MVSRQLEASDAWLYASCSAVRVAGAANVPIRKLLISGRPARSIWAPTVGAAGKLGVSGLPASWWTDASGRLLLSPQPATTSASSRDSDFARVACMVGSRSRVGGAPHSDGRITAGIDQRLVDLHDDRHDVAGYEFIGARGERGPHGERLARHDP